MGTIPSAAGWPWQRPFAASVPTDAVPEPGTAWPDARLTQVLKLAPGQGITLGDAKLAVGPVIGTITGLTALIGFAVPPIAQLRHTSPARVLKRDLGTGHPPAHLI